MFWCAYAPYILSSNDLVYRSDGTLLFTDPPFGLPAVLEDPDKELPFSGEIALANQIPKKFLDTILLELRNAGIVRSRTSPSTVH